MHSSWKMELTIVVTSHWKLSWSRTWNKKKASLWNCFLITATYDCILNWQITSEYQACVQCATSATLIQEVSDIFHHLWLAVLALTWLLARLFVLNIFLFPKFPSLCIEWFRLFLMAWPWKPPKGVKELLQNHGIPNLTTLNKLSCTYPCSVKPQWKMSWHNHLKWYHDKITQGPASLKQNILRWCVAGKSLQNYTKNAFNVQLMPHSYKRCQKFFITGDFTCSHYYDSCTRRLHLPTVLALIGDK